MLYTVYFVPSSSLLLIKSCPSLSLDDNSLTTTHVSIFLLHTFAIKGSLMPLLWCEAIIVRFIETCLRQVLYCIWRHCHPLQIIFCTTFNDSIIYNYDKLFMKAFHRRISWCQCMRRTCLLTRFETYRRRHALRMDSCPVLY